MHLSTLPKIEPITLPGVGWTLTDYRQLAQPAIRQATRLWGVHIQRVLGDRNVNSSELICNVPGDVRSSRIADRFAATRKTEPDLSYEDYLKRYTPERDTDPDPRMAQLWFQIEQGQTLLGGLSVSNITAHRQDSAEVAVSGVFLLGVPTEPLGVARVWSDFFGELLTTDLAMSDGRLLKLERYEFLVDKDVRAQAQSDPELRAYVRAMRSKVDVLGEVDRPDERIEFRRPGAGA